MAARVLTWGWVAVIVVPLVYLVSVSLATSAARDQFVFGIFPRSPTFESYPLAFELMARLGQPLPQVFANSIVITGLAVAGASAAAALASFAIVFLRLPGRKTIFAILCIGLVVPTSVMIVPEFLAARTMGLRGHPALVLCYIAFGISLPTLLLSSFFATIPRSIVEAARIDGASHWRLFWSVVLPLSRPALATVALLLFITFWNEFPLASVFISEASQSTIPVALSRMTSRQGLPYSIVAAVMVLAAIPLVLTMLLGQRQLVDGLSQGAEKG